MKRSPNLQTLGVRDLLSIDDEIQGNGKTFKKVNISNLKNWIFRFSIRSP